MKFYVVRRVQAKEAWQALSDDEQKKWLSEYRKQRDDAGIKMVGNYESYRGGRTAILEVPSMEAWDKYRRKMKARPPEGLGAVRYFETDYEYCHEV